MYDRKSMQTVIDRIASAVKFEMAHDFAQAADELGNDLGAVAKALEFCRLPYREIWVEVVANDRRHFIDGTPPGILQRLPIRVGFLLTATRDSLDAFKAHIFWNCADDLPGVMATNAGAIAMQFDMKRSFIVTDAATAPQPDSSDQWNKISNDERRKLLAACIPDMPDFLPSPVMGLGGRHSVELVMDYARKDWFGEPSFLEATLALLNARNASETIFVDNKRYNEKRARKGKLPLSSHHVLRIHPRQRARMKAVNGSPTDREIRSHFVRGHWKVRTTGVYFWRPFMRGKLAHGYVGKDYVLD